MEKNCSWCGFETADEFFNLFEVDYPKGDKICFFCYNTMSSYREDLVVRHINMMLNVLWHKLGGYKLAQKS
jgi:hypothetical protein